MQKYQEVAQDKARMKLRDNNDCTVVALAVLTGLPYKIAHAELKAAGRRDGQGFVLGLFVKAMERCHLRGMEQLKLKRQTIKTFGERMAGSPYKYLLVTRDHVAAFVDGKVEDWSRDSGAYIKRAYRLNN